MIQHYTTLTNSEISERIGERIHSAKYRRILHLKLIDGMSCEAVSEAVGMSPVQIQRIVQKCRKLIEK